jgi:organic radical activating enzyme
MKKYRYSEIFGNTIQGEAHYNGRISVWIRFFMCNLECNGFGQQNPTDPSTYVLPYQEFDVSTIKKVEDLPVWSYGCDSSYSWAKQYAHLVHQDTAVDIAAKLKSYNVSDTNPLGKWIHPLTKNKIHMCFTGGEPLMQQDAIINIMKVMIDTGDYPLFVTIETNATKNLSKDFIEFVKMTQQEHGIEWLFSTSPKLFSVSGETKKKAWKPEAIEQYSTVADKLVCKFVVNENAIYELLNNIEEIKHLDKVEYWAMPVGATLEDQEKYSIQFIEKLIGLGFYIADRTHIRLFSNVIGK